MKLKRVIALVPLVLLGTPLYAQIDQKLCVECLATAKEELKKCLDAAISQEDKTFCAEKKRHEREPAMTVSAKLKERRKVEITLKALQKRIDLLHLEQSVKHSWARAEISMKPDCIILLKSLPNT